MSGPLGMSQIGLRTGQEEHGWVYVKDGSVKLDFLGNLSTSGIKGGTSWFLQKSDYQ